VSENGRRAADHRENLARRRADRDERAFDARRSLGLGAIDPPGHGILRDVLHRRVERRIDLQPPSNVTCVPNCCSIWCVTYVVKYG